MAKNVKNNENMYQTITHNVKPKVRYDTMEGKKFLVVPSVAIVEGVHNGSNGPLYYPASELSKTPQVWNTKPVVVYHPEINGRGVSACDPVIMSSRKVGEMMNTVFEDGKLKTEVWIDEEAANRIDKRIIDAIQNEKIMELSTGLFTDNDYQEGDWNGEPYMAIARNYRPDHLALLPDKVGACSVEDGAGFLRVNSLEENEEDEFTLSERFAEDFFPFLEAAGIDTKKLVSNQLSHDSIREQIYSVLRKFKPEAFIEAVYDDKFIYADDGKLFLQKYSIKKDVLKTTGLPEEVVRVIEYRTAQGTVIGNEYENLETKGMKVMDKEKLVNSIIENSQSNFEESDREYLMGLEENRLKNFLPKVTDNMTVNNQTEKKDNDKKKTEVIDNDKPITIDEYVNKAPAEMKDVLQNGLNSYRAEKKRLINTITANERNVFTNEQLEAMTIDSLKAISQLAVTNDKKNSHTPLYDGLLDPVDNTQADIGEIPVPLSVVTRNDEQK